jgi:hypothetical protein
MNKTPILVSLLLGLALLAGAWAMYASTRGLIDAAAKAPGIVVDFQRRSSKGGSSDYPVVEFTTPSGETRTFTTSGSGSYSRGQAVEVLYDASDPSTARVNVFLELWLGTLALGGFGLLCLGVGVGSVLYGRSRRKTGTV